MLKSGGQQLDRGDAGLAPQPRQAARMVRCLNSTMQHGLRWGNVLAPSLAHSVTWPRRSVSPGLFPHLQEEGCNHTHSQEHWRTREFMP